MSTRSVIDTNRDGKSKIADDLPFPMWVCPIKTMIEVTAAAEAGGDAKLVPHEVLQEQGRLIQWQPGMKTLFFSHTYARRAANPVVAIASLKDQHVEFS